MRRLFLLFLAGGITMMLLVPVRQLIPQAVPLPNIALLLTLYLALGVKGSASGGAAAAGGLGYLADLFSGSPRGMYMLALMIIYFVVRGLSTRLYVQGKLSQVGIAFAGSLACSLIVVALHVALPPRGTWATLMYAPGEAGMTAAMGPLVFYLTWRFDRRLGREAATEGVFR